MYFLKAKNDTVKANKIFFADVTPYGIVKCVQTDNGTEFMGKEFQALLNKNSIRRVLRTVFTTSKRHSGEKLANLI